MRAVVFEEFGVLPVLRTVPDPVPAPDGVVITVEATGDGVRAALHPLQ